MGILNSLTGGGTMQSLMTPKPLPSMPQQPTYGGLLNNLRVPSPMGIPAKNPNTNVPSPTTTIPKNQAGTPAPVASFDHPITSKTASGGSMIDYGSGKVYSNPTDDPGYKPAITAPPVNTATVQSQLTQAQNQLKTATAMGYGANDQIQKDTNGNIVQNPAHQPAPSSQYAGLVNTGTNALKQEALSQNAIANDPNFSIETQLGKEGQAQQSLAGQATAAFQGATAVAPVQVPYSNQYLNPTTGQPVNGGQSGQLPQDAQNIVNTYYAPQVQSGAMTRVDAESRLAPYGIAGTNALAQALGPNFNTNASNASGATTATGQQLAAAIPAATQALDALQTAFTNLPSVQQTGIPLLNQISQGTAMLTGVGRDQASAFQGALQEARSRIDAALTGAIGVNAAQAQASALLPDNMVPSELPQKIAAAKQYLQNQLASYSNSGNQNTSSGSTVTQSTPDTSVIDGTAFKKVNGQWVVSQ